MGAARDGSIRALYPSRSRPYCRPQHAPNARQQQRSAPVEMAVEVVVVEGGGGGGGKRRSSRGRAAEGSPPPPSEPEAIEDDDDEEEEEEEVMAPLRERLGSKRKGSVGAVRSLLFSVGRRRGMRRTVHRWREATGKTSSLFPIYAAAAAAASEQAAASGPSEQAARQ